MKCLFIALSLVLTVLCVACPAFAQLQLMGGTTFYTQNGNIASVMVVVQGHAPMEYDFDTNRQPNGFSEVGFGTPANDAMVVITCGERWEPKFHDWVQRNVAFRLRGNQESCRFRIFIDGDTKIGMVEMTGTRLSWTEDIDDQVLHPNLADLNAGAIDYNRKAYQLGETVWTNQGDVGDGAYSWLDTNGFVFPDRFACTQQQLLPGERLRWGVITNLGSGTGWPIVTYFTSYDRHEGCIYHRIPEQGVVLLNW